MKFKDCVDTFTMLCVGNMVGMLIHSSTRLTAAIDLILDVVAISVMFLIFKFIERKKRYQ